MPAKAERNDFFGLTVGEITAALYGFGQDQLVSRAPLYAHDD